MAMYLCTIFMFCIIGLGTSAVLNNKPPIKVTVFSESYCPDCIQYHAKQLLPAFNYFTSNLRIDLVPFGNAEQTFVDGHWVFECQHGEKECYGNKMQACAILQACGEKGSVHCSTDNVGKVLKYITCVEADPDQKGANEKCAKESSLDPATIVDCASGDKGEYLLNMYGNRTKAFTPPIRYVPFVAINNVHKVRAENNLHKLICQMRPDLCEKHEEEEVIMINDTSK